MIHQIALDPRLDLSAAEFVDAWNASEYADQATAMLQPPTRSETFMSPEMTVALVTLAGTIPVSIIASVISAHLTKRFTDSDQPPDRQPNTQTINVNIKIVEQSSDQALLAAVPDEE